MDRPRWHRSVMYAAGFSAVTTVGLGVLTYGLGLMHALSYGAIAILAPESVTAPEPDRYRLAFVVGAGANVTVALLLAWVAARTPARTWPSVVQGLAATLTAAVVATWALLLTLGISPMDFLTDLS